MDIYYEAYHENEPVSIYTGHSKTLLISEIKLFIHQLPNKKFDHLTDELIESLDRKALDRAGITIYCCPF